MKKTIFQILWTLIYAVLRVTLKHLGDNFGRKIYSSERCNIVRRR